MRQALDAGARGYILKNPVDLELASRIRRVAAGDIVMASELSDAYRAKRRTHAASLPRELRNFATHR